MSDREALEEIALMVLEQERINATYYREEPRDPQARASLSATRRTIANLRDALSKCDPPIF